MSSKGTTMDRGAAVDRRKANATQTEFADLLSAGAYEQLSQLLGKLRSATPQDNAALAAILGAAQQLCLACASYREDLKSHLHIHEEAIRREAGLQTQLGKLLDYLHNDPQVNDPAAVWAILGHDTELRRVPAPGTAMHAEATESANIAAEPDASATDVTRPAPGPTSGHRAQSARPASSVSTAPAESQTYVPSLSVYCLGTFAVYADEQTIQEWPSRKAKSIFKFLLAHRQRSINKEVLMDSFWPDADPDAARNNLNVAISSLRQTLRDDHPDFKYVLFQQDCYHLNPLMQIWVDSEAFMLALENARNFERQGNVTAAITEYQTARDLYQGPFLSEDLYDDWLISKRRALQENYLDALNRLGEFRFDRGQYGVCADTCRDLLEIDTCREDIHRRLMHCYSRQGQRHLALRQYHLCAEALQSELDLTPSAATTMVYTELRRDAGT